MYRRMPANPCTPRLVLDSGGCRSESRGPRQRSSPSRLVMDRGRFESFWGEIRRRFGRRGTTRRLSARKPLTGFPGFQSLHLFIPTLHPGQLEQSLVTDLPSLAQQYRSLDLRCQEGEDHEHGDPGLAHPQPTQFGGHLPRQALKPDLQTLLYTTATCPFWPNPTSQNRVYGALLIEQHEKWVGITWLKSKGA